jgi:hypothetical protein
MLASTTVKGVAALAAAGRLVWAEGVNDITASTSARNGTKGFMAGS